MQVAYFSNQFADAQGHGLSRYARELFRALTEVSGGPKVTPVAAWSSLDQAGVSQLEQDSGLRILPLGRRLTPLCWTFAGTPRLEGLLGQEVDLVHAASLGYPVATRKPLVVTIHDLGPLSHPEFFHNTRPWVYRRSLAQVVKQASRIICVSRSSADELLAVAGADLHRRIEIIHEGVAAQFFNSPAHDSQDRPETLPSASPYILSTGKISPRKNISGVIEAFAAVVDQLAHHLVLVGGDGWEVEPIHQLITQHGLSGRVHFSGYVSDKSLCSLYAGASAYLHPSLYEGFGLTLLEAMAAGCPVITSNRTSLPEVAGDAALLVDPMCTEEIASAIFEVCSNAPLATELRQRGRARAARFTWQEAAQLTTRVYQAALG